MNENLNNTLWGQSPARYGLASVIAVGLAYVSLQLAGSLGALMVYVAMLLAFIAVVAGLLGVGTGIYFKQWVGVVTGVLGLGMTGYGVYFIAWALTHF